MAKKKEKKKIEKKKEQSFTRDNRPKGVSKREWDVARKKEGKDPKAKFFSDPKAKPIQKKQTLTPQAKQQADQVLQQYKAGGQSIAQPVNPLTAPNPYDKFKAPQTQSIAPKLSPKEQSQADEFLIKLRGSSNDTINSNINQNQDQLRFNAENPIQVQQPNSFRPTPQGYSPIQTPEPRLGDFRSQEKPQGSFLSRLTAGLKNFATNSPLGKATEQKSVSPIINRESEVTKKVSPLENEKQKAIRTQLEMMSKIKTKQPWSFGVSQEKSNISSQRQDLEKLYEDLGSPEFKKSFKEAKQEEQFNEAMIVGSFAGNLAGISNKLLAETKSIDLVRSALKGQVGQDVLEQTATKIVQATKPKEVEEIIKAAKTLSTETGIKKIVTGVPEASTSTVAEFKPKVEVKTPVVEKPLQEGGKINTKDYATAEEFVKSHTPIFRGAESTPRRVAGMTQEYTGTSFSRKREVAQNYGDNMFYKYLPENEILKAEDLPSGTLKELRNKLSKLPSVLEAGDSIETEKLITEVMKIAKQNNKKAADIASIFPEMADEAEIRLLGKVTDAKTKSQLVSEFNKSKLSQPQGITPSVSKINTTPEALSRNLDKKLSQSNTYSKNLAQTNKNVNGKGFISSVKNSPELSQDLANKVGELQQTYKVKRNSPMVQKAQELVSSNPTEAERIAKNGLDDTSVFTGSELIKQYDQAAQQAKNEIERNAYLDKAVEIADKMDTNLREHGRAIQAASAISNLSPAGILRWATKELRLASEKGGGKIELTNEMAGKFLKRANEIQNIGDPKLKAKEVYKLFDEIHSLVPSSLGDKIISVWKAGLLTGLKTTGVNITSNVLHGSLEVAKDVPASAVDSVVSLFTKKRTVSPTVKGAGTGLKEGFQKGWDYLKTGFDERNIASKYDYRKVNFGNSKVGKTIQGYEEGVFRLMGAEDQPFYYGTKARSLYQQAKIAGKNKGLSGEGLNNFVDEFVKSPTDDAIRNATKDAEIATFTASNKLSDWTKGAQGPVAQFIMPFRKTPANVAMQAINYSPVGIVKTIIENIGKGKFDQRAFSKGLGRGITGTGIFATGAALMNKGMLTLSSPKDAKERNQWELEGKKPNSIKWGDRYVQAGSLGPIGMTMLVGGYYQKALNETGSQTEALSQAVAGLGKSLVDQTFLKGVSGFLDAINDPTRYASNIYENTVGSTVPTIIGDIARSKDSVQRETNGAIESFMSRIPGQREKLSPQVDVFGKGVPRGEGAFGTMVDFMRGNNIRNQDNPVVNELSRLIKGGENGTPNEITAKQKVNGQDIELDQAKVNDMKKFVGSKAESIYKDFMNTGYYKALPDDKKAQELSNINSDIKTLAKHELLKDTGDFKTEQQIKDSVKDKQVVYEATQAKEVSDVYDKIDSMTPEQQKLFNEQKKGTKQEGLSPYNKYDNPTSQKAENTRTFKERLNSSDPKEALRFLKKLDPVEQKRIKALLDNKGNEEVFKKYNQITKTSWGLSDGINPATGKANITSSVFLTKLGKQLQDKKDAQKDKDADTMPLKKWLAKYESKII